ncbi:MAG: pyroglutamyl-peptidase I, partial [Tissierellia bacterium]|nr:pyroglutamyl-peptidase I [Tissierellia bacterium]
MKILVTAFDPFGGEKVNPALEAVKKLPDTISGATIIKQELPTVFKRSICTLEKAIDDNKPDVVLSIGQAGGRYDITVEKVGINLQDARIPDNDNEQPIDEKIFEDGDTAYFATI